MVLLLWWKSKMLSLVKYRTECIIFALCLAFGSVIFIILNHNVIAMIMQIIGVFVVWFLPNPEKPPEVKIRVICEEGVWHLQYKQWHSIGGYHWIDYHQAGTEVEVMTKLEELKEEVYNPQNGTERYY